MTPGYSFPEEAEAWKRGPIGQDMKMVLPYESLCPGTQAQENQTRRIPKQHGGGPEQIHLRDYLKMYISDRCLTNLGIPQPSFLEKPH